MTADSYVKLGRRTTIVSFILGTALFVAYYLTSSGDLLFVGYAFIVLAIIVNLLVLLFILDKVGKAPEVRKELHKTCWIMLVNIPIMVLYCWIAIVLLNTMRITFINATNDTLTDITIKGCGTKHIDRLQAGESKTVWITIPGDCLMSMDYLRNDERKEEVVAGYLTTNMGQKVDYNIGDGKDLMR